jgi:hypothetical protein
MSRATGVEQGKVRNFFPAYRVFIAGVEVTRLCSSVRNSWSDHNPAQVVVELVNPNQLMTLTAYDMLLIAAYKQQAVSQALAELSAEFNSRLLRLGSENVFQRALGELQDQFPIDPQDVLNYYADIARQDLIFPQVGNLPPPLDIFADLKNTILAKKLELVYQQGTIGIDGQPLPNEAFFKYPMVQGQWIWHTEDPVVVAVRDVADPSRWYWFGRGTITDISEDEDENMQSKLNITVEGVLKPFRNSRVANFTGAILSPREFKTAAGDVTTISPEDYSQIQNASYTNFLQNLTIQQIVEIMVFGSQSVLDDLGQAVRAVQQGDEPEALLQERFGIPVNSEGAISDQAISAFQQQLRNLNISGLGGFKRFSRVSGVDVRILGGGNADNASDVVLGTQTPSLSEWHKLLDNEITTADFYNMYIPDAVQTGVTSNTSGRPVPPLQWLAQGTVRGNQLNLNTQVDQGTLLEQVITAIGTHPENYPIRQRVLMLLPANLGARLGRKVLDLEIANSAGSVAEFYDRLSLLQQILSRMEFSFYDTPRGDVVIEMPLYDFEPRHFANTNELSDQYTEGPTGTGNVTQTFTNVEEQLTADAAFQELTAIEKANLESVVPTTTAYDRTFRIFPFEQIRINITRSDQDAKTVWVATPRWTEAIARDGSQASRQRVAVALPNLIPLYGIRVEQGDPPGNIRTDEAARLYCYLQLMKCNADIVSLRVPCLPNWGAWLNRPVQVDSRNIIGSTKSITHSIVWQSDCSTEYGFWHCKFWDGRFVPTATGPRKLYSTFGGVNSQPFNYSYLLQIDKISAALGAQPGQADANLSAVFDTIRNGR